MLGTTPSESKAGTIMLTLLRVIAGTIMTAHGLQKLAGFAEWKSNVTAMHLPYPDIAAGLALAGELAGGVGLLLGAITPVAAFGIAATMLVAILKVHLPHGLFAKDGGFEYPLMLLTTSLFFMIRGPGPYSVDAMLDRLSRRRLLPRPTSFGRPLGSH